MAATNDWVDIASAAGTVGAVVIALALALMDGRRRNTERRDAERARARLVLFQRVEVVTDAYAYSIVNYTSQPVLKVTVLSLTAVDLATQERYSASKAKVRRPMSDAEASLPLTQEVLHPWKEGRPEWSLVFTDWAPEGGPLNPDWMPRGGWEHAQLDCRYRFTDADGGVWERVNDGEPKRVPTSAA